MTSAPGPTITFDAVGDILLDRGLGRKIRQFGPDYPFHSIASTLHQSDLAFGNLECPLTTREFQVVQHYLFHAKPEYADSLLRGGIVLVSLANNHTMDCGSEGLLDTMETLRQRGIRDCGAGRTMSEALDATWIDVHGIRLAFLAYCDFAPSASAPLAPDKPTIAYASEEAVRRAVAQARRQADVVIVSFHWGIEHTLRPTERQIRLAHTAAQAGADLVLGHHPHVLQGFEVVAASAAKPRPTLIAYSLGSFVFDGHADQEKRSILLRCTLSKAGLVGVRLLPVRIEHSAPRLATAEEAASILAQLTSSSADRHTTIAQGQIALSSLARLERRRGP